MAARFLLLLSENKHKRAKMNFYGLLVSVVDPYMFENQSITIYESF